MTAAAMDRDEQTAHVAAALLASLTLHAVLLASLSVWRSAPVHVVELHAATIKVAVLEVGKEMAGPGVRGPALLDGAPPLPAQGSLHISTPPPATKEEPARAAEIPPQPETMPELPPAPRPEAKRITDRKPPAPPAKRETAAAGAAAPKASPSGASGPSAIGESATSSSTPSPGLVPGQGGTGRSGGQATAPQWAPSARAGYHQVIQAWIERYKVYPSMAQRRHLQGDGRITIRIDRRGRVLSRSIEQSTGQRLLDLAALETVDRASPFPAMPADYPGETFLFTYPFTFRLR